MAESKGTQWAVAVAIGVVVAGAFGWPFVCMCMDHAGLASAPGKAAGAMTVTDQQGVQLLLFDDVRRGDSSGERLVAIDAATGRETGRHLRRGYGRIECRTSGLSRLWCNWRNGNPQPWALVDPRTLRETTDVLHAVEAAKLGHVAPRPIELRGDAAYVTLDDGRIVAWDARTRAITVEALIPDDERSSGARSGCSTSSTYEYRTSTMQLLGDPRTRLVIGDATAEEAGGPRGAEFLKPGFADLKLSDGALVLHESSLDPKRSIPQLSFVDWKGQIVWTAPLGAPCETIQNVSYPDGTFVLVTTTGRKPRAIAFDARTGAVRWRLDR